MRGEIKASFKEWPPYNHKSIAQKAWDKYGRLLLRKKASKLTK